MVLIQQMSWGAFGLTAIVLTLIYYGWLGWRYYRPELLAVFKKPVNDAAVPAAPDAEPQFVLPSKPDEGFTELDSEELEFAVPVEQEAPEQQDVKTAQVSKAAYERIKHEHLQAALLGSVADTMEEAKKLLDDAKAAGENKERVLEILGLLSPDLQELAGTTYPDALRLFLYDEITRRFDFPLTPDELLPLWQSVTQSHTPKKLKV